MIADSVRLRYVKVLYKEFVFSADLSAWCTTAVRKTGKLHLLHLVKNSWN